jgi:hypothetical protein
MSALSIEVPFPVFQDRDGQPLENGYVWIGVANLNPQTNPVIAYFDKALTIPAAQPLRTINGYISNAGTPAQVYVDGVNFSILVQDSKGSMVYNFPDGTGVNPTVNAEDVIYDPPFANAVQTNVENKLAESASAKDFGAVGDGVADDTVSLQNALNSNQLIFLPKGNYRITSSLIIDPVVNRNSGFVGQTSISEYPTTTEPGGPTWNGNEEVVITYDGPASTITPIIQASAEPVGTQVAQTFGNTIFGFRLESVVLDGNDKAGFGLYAIRLSEPEVQNVIVTRTTQHAFYIDQAYSGRYEKINAFKNNGCGISVGRGTLDYGWTAGRFVNAVYFSDLYAAANGADKTFDETTNPEWGYGIGLWLHRGNVVTAYTSENNDGVGIYLSPTSFPNVILSGYSELSNSLIINGTNAITDGRATRKWGCWFDGDVSASSLHMRLCNVFMGAEGIRLTGTEPSAGRKEGGFSLENIAGANYLEADWGNYRLINCSEEIFNNITGSFPVGSAVFTGGIQFDPTSVGIMNAYDFDTFTPSLRGQTIAGTGWAYAINQGSYVRVGNMVTVTGRIALSAASVDATGAIVIAGLPFNIKTSNPYNGAATLAQLNNLSTSIVSATANYILNSDQIAISIRTAASTSSASLVLSDISNTFSFNFTGTYFVD